MWTYCAESLRSQPGPQEQRERQYQRPSSVVRVRTRRNADRREALIGSPVVAHRRSAVVTGGFPEIAQAAGSSAVAPIAGCGMAGIGDRRKRRCADEFGAIGR